LFDTSGKGFIDLKQLAAGISVLCRGNGEDRIRLAFSVFDDDGDGRITKDEMDRYLTAFFKVCFDLSPHMQHGFKGVSPRDLGSATAAHCFREADHDGDGKVSFEEFKRWYSQQPNPMFGGEPASPSSAAGPNRAQSASYGPIITTRAARKHHHVPMPYVAHRKRKIAASGTTLDVETNGLQKGATHSDNDGEDDDDDADEEEEEKMITSALRRRCTKNDAALVTAGRVTASAADRNATKPAVDLAAAAAISSRLCSEEATGLRPPTRRRGDVVVGDED